MAQAAPRPPFRADHVGSLLRPAELKAARDRARRGEISPEALRKVEDKCIQCGFSSTHHGNKITVDDERRKLALALEVAQEVWGG